MSVRVGIGQDSHAFDLKNPSKKLILGGIEIKNFPGLRGNSDADVVLHALTNAVSGVTGVNILGERSDYLCFQKGIVDSAEYLKDALRFLRKGKIIHASISIEAKEPKLTPYIDSMRNRVAEILGISANNVGITATSGEGLTAFGQGKGIQAIAIITAEVED